MRRLTVLGVPNSAGAYCVGVEKAPAALRDAGLISALGATGNDVVDAGDLTVRRWIPDRERPLSQNLDEEIAAVEELATTASGLIRPNERLLVVGGSCTVAVGLCAAVARVGLRPRIVYVDRHLDLNTPLSTVEGSLSWMGMAHALDLPGVNPLVPESLRPLLTAESLSYAGVDLDATTAGERSAAVELGLPVVTQAELVADPPAAAHAARDALGEGPFVVHVDVDVLDFLDAPIAENVNGRNSGPTIVQLGQALAVLWADPDCLGLSLGQLDPAHAASDPTALPRLVSALADALAN
ncbi:arginase [Actinosynnema sp. ALI-1.44]|uniref:arginase family protein n=1 Tax=Actinosynnema sp. ALI-1.44 TaxID=1933779 RepID=UPI00097C2578|nr:arginase family protein [Actinosynnema sp. ALI-1.44]ONI89314.1 arginase [Actinosynnema sp. ALI-1.44]